MIKKLIILLFITSNIMFGEIIRVDINKIQTIDQNNYIKRDKSDLYITEKYIRIKGFSDIIEKQKKYTYDEFLLNKCNNNGFKNFKFIGVTSSKWSEYFYVECYDKIKKGNKNEK